MPWPETQAQPNMEHWISNHVYLSNRIFDEKTLCRYVLEKDTCFYPMQLHKVSAHATCCLNKNRTQVRAYKYGRIDTKTNWFHIISMRCRMHMAHDDCPASRGGCKFMITNREEKKEYHKLDCMPGPQYSLFVCLPHMLQVDFSAIPKRTDLICSTMQSIKINFPISLTSAINHPSCGYILFIRALLSLLFTTCIDRTDSFEMRGKKDMEHIPIDWLNDQIYQPRCRNISNMIGR